MRPLAAKLNGVCSRAARAARLLAAVVPALLGGGVFLVTDHSFNRLLLLSPQGLELGAFGCGLEGPTATLLLPGRDGGDPAVVVTERDRAAVSRRPLRPVLDYLGVR